jgi:hypothetical protein
MCQRCEEDLATFTAAEIEADAMAASRLAAIVLTEVPNTVRGCLLTLAAARAIETVLPDLFALLDRHETPGEHLTPRMREFAEGVGAMAAAKILAAARG